VHLIENCLYLGNKMTGTKRERTDQPHNADAFVKIWGAKKKAPILKRAKLT